MLYRRSQLIAAMFALLTALSCTAGSQRSATSELTSSRDSVQPEMLLALPDPAALDGLSAGRSSSEVPQFAQSRDGDAALLSSSAVTLNALDQTAEIVTSAGGLSWAVYEFPGVEAGLQVGGVQAWCPSIDGAQLFIALSDFEHNRWELLGSTQGELGPFKTATSDPVTMANYISPGGSVYVALLCWDDTDAVVRFVNLGAGVTFDVVQDFAASRGGSTDSIELSWTAYPEAQAYLIRYRLLGSEAPFETIAETTGSAVNFTHSPASPPGEEPQKNTRYEYSIQARLGEGLHTAAVMADGYAGLGSPQNMMASYRSNAFTQILRWDKVPGATGYNLYRSDMPGELITALGDVDEYFDDSQPDPVKFNDLTYTLFAVDGDGEALEGSSVLGALMQINHIAISSEVHHDGQIAGALFDTDIPYYMDKQADDDSMRMFRCTTGEPADSGDFSEFVVDGPGVDGTHNALGIIAGFPALMILDRDHDLFRYGYATVKRPFDAEDWEIANAPVLEDTADSFDFTEIDGKPALVFAMSDGVLNFATPADATPQGPQDWTITEIEDGLTGSGAYPAIVNLDSLPAVAYGSTNSELRFALASSVSPQGPSDWQRTAVDSTGVTIEKDMALIDGRPAIAYPAADSLGAFHELRFALAHSASPASAEDWDVIEVRALNDFHTGHIPQIVQLHGRIGIIHESFSSDPFPQRSISYSQSLVALPTQSRQWASAPLFSEFDTISGSHSALVLEGGVLGLMYNNYDTEQFGFDLAYIVENVPTQ